MPSATAAKAKKANATLKSKINKAPVVVKEVDDQSGQSEDESDFGSDLDGEDELAGSDEEEEDEEDEEEHDSDEDGVSDEDDDNDEEENQSAGSGSDSDADSDSDSLDSNAPRKRRRTSPNPIDDIVAQIEDEEEEEPVAPVKPVFNNVPSRIKKKQPEAPKTENKTGEETTPATLPVPEPASTVSVPIDANTTFDALNVRPWLVQSLANMAIKRPTGIQKGCIPEILKGRDCIGGSRTGSGKTAAFAVPILQQWAANPSAIFGLILTPTRYVHSP